MGPKAPAARVISAQGTYSTLGDKWERSLESGGPKHPHFASKAENQAANLERVDPAQSPGEGDNYETGADCSKHPLHGRQV